MADNKFKKKTAVVLFNIGGPDAPQSIEPFLTNFFSDPNIIGLPGFLRKPLARRIARRRAQGPAQEAYGRLGGKSPLLENTNAQARALQNALGPGYCVFVSMRYWHPLRAQALQDVISYGPDECVLLPLYPQFSTTTSNSSLKDWLSAAQQAGLSVPTRTVCCYPEMEGFISASVRLIRENVPSGKNVRVLFSAHGLPEKVVRGGDPYQWQCEQTAQRIAQELGLQDWEMCYQSRVGPLKWIGPSTEEALEKAAHDGVGVAVYPLAFVSEHVETLVEIEIEYREKAQHLGVPFFIRVPTVGTAPEFIEGLADIVRRTPTEKICPGGFKRCWQAQGFGCRMAS